MNLIDFCGGAHGNYLEFVCNKFIARVPASEHPFSNTGAAHNKDYPDGQDFMARHWSQLFPKLVLNDDVSEYTDAVNGIIEPAKRVLRLLSNEEYAKSVKNIISIQFAVDDLLPLTSISLLRAGDYGIDNDQLEINTYHKLDNPVYRPMLDIILDNFFNSQIKNSYDNVRDPSWPDVNTMEDFKNLPEHIKEECASTHNLTLLELSPGWPNCPRDVLVEFFKIGFKHPTKNGLWIHQQQINYHPDNRVFIFPYRVFYDTQLFIEQLNLLADWLNLPQPNAQEVTQLHKEFLKRQPYKDSKQICDQLIDKFNSGYLTSWPKLDLLQQAYILAQVDYPGGLEFFS